MVCQCVLWTKTWHNTDNWQQTQLPKMDFTFWPYKNVAHLRCRWGGNPLGFGRPWFCHTGSGRSRVRAGHSAKLEQSLSAGDPNPCPWIMTTSHVGHFNTPIYLQLISTWEASLELVFKFQWKSYLNFQLNSLFHPHLEDPKNSKRVTMFQSSFRFESSKFPHERWSWEWFVVFLFLRFCKS